MRVLILGGTGEARALAERLHLSEGVEVISSLAGTTRNPQLPPGLVRVGGFGGPREIAAYLAKERISIVVDATHPFAAKITENARAAAVEAGTTFLVLRRPGWHATAEDRWLRVASLELAATAVATLPPGAVLVTTGRRHLAAFAADAQHHYVIRTVDPPEGPLPPRTTLLTARGPFTYDDELALFREHRVTALVTKDSGGPMTDAKLLAARQLRLRVVMIDRPPIPEDTILVPSVAKAEKFIKAHWS